MTPKTRHRSRSSVDHIFELVENLEEDQLQDLLHELNSTGDNVQVSRGVEFFDERLRRTGSRGSKDTKHPLRPTPSFLNQPHEPADWPRQKPRPVSGSHWRQSMRIVSSPYATAKNSSNDNGGGIARHQTEPISPPLTASPPSSPPLSPPQSAIGYLDGSPRRSVTAPLLKTGGASSRVEVRVHGVPSPDSPVSPPRHSDEEEDDDEDREHSRPSLSEFGSFSFGLAGTETPSREQQEKKRDERPVSPRAAAAAAAAAASATTSTPPPPQPDFSRISTMPLPTLHHHEPLDIFSEQPPRPRTSTGDPSAFAKPRAFRRISRPTFLSPVATAAPDDLARKLSAYLFEDLAPPTSPPPPPPPAAARTRGEEDASLEEMLREPLTPRSRFVFGRAEREVPSVSGIFEVLTEG